MARDQRVQILISATDRASQALGEVRAQLRQMGDTAQDAGRRADVASAGINSMGVAVGRLKGLFAGLAAAVGIGFLTGLIRQSLDAADALNKLSQRLGISVERLSTLGPVAELAGVGAEGFATALQLLAKQQTEAATGAKEAAVAFDALGVSVQGKGGQLKPLDQLLLELADKFRELPDGAEKTALAMDLFGRSGAELIPFLNQGRGGIAALTDELHLLGVGLGAEAAAQAEVFNDSLAKISLAVGGAANRVTADLLPALNELANQFVESAKEGGNFRNVMDGIGGVLKVLALGAVGVGTAIAAVGESLGALFAAAFSATSGQAKSILADLETRLREKWDSLGRLKRDLFDGEANPKGAGAADKPPQTDAQRLALERVRAALAAAREKSEKESVGHARDGAAEARRAAEAERQLAEALLQARLRLGELTGTATDADRRAVIEASYAKLRAALAEAGNTEGVALVDRLIDVQAWDAKLQALETRWRAALERMRNAEQSANIQEQQGLITTWEAQRQIGAAHAEASAELERLLPLMEQAAHAIGPEAVARVQAWKNELASVRTVIDPTVQALRTTMETSFAAAFTAFITGAQTAKQAFAGFVRSVIAGLAQIAAQQMARALFGSLFGGLLGGFSGGGSVPAIGKASGGIIRGPGTGTSDSVPAWLSDGEYVVRAAAVRRLGVGFLDFLNAGPDLPRHGLAFAGGGRVDLGATESPSRATPTAPPAGVRIVNVIDPRLAGDYLNSSAGERTILNVLSRHAGAVRQLLR